MNTLPILTITQEDNEKSRMLLSQDFSTLCNCCPVAIALNRTTQEIWFVNGTSARRKSDGEAEWYFPDNLVVDISNHDSTRRNLYARMILGTYTLIPNI